MTPVIEAISPDEIEDNIITPEQRIEGMNNLTVIINSLIKERMKPSMNTVHISNGEINVRFLKLKLKEYNVPRTDVLEKFKIKGWHCTWTPATDFGSGGYVFSRSEFLERKKYSLEGNKNDNN